MGYKSTIVKSILTEPAVRDIFDLCGVDIPRTRFRNNGWITGLYVPSEIREDKNADFSVNLENGSVNDFGSSYSNDIIGFVQDVLNIRFGRAIDIVRAHARRHAYQEINDYITEKNTMGSLQPLSIEEISEASAALLQKESRLLKYLIQKRGIHEKTIQRFRLGKYWHNGDPCLLVPYAMDEDERVTNYKLMAFDPNKMAWVQEDGRKKVRTSGSAQLYPKRSLKSDKVVICEGELDVLTLRQAGINAVTGTAGAGTFKREWAEFICTATSYASTMFDGDEAGRKGAKDTAEVLLSNGLDRVLLGELPDGMDVNDCWIAFLSSRFESMDEDDLILESTHEEFRSRIQQLTFSPYHMDPTRTGAGSNMSVDGVLTIIEERWGDMSDHEKSEAIQGMMKILSNEGLSIVKTYQPN